MEAEVLWRRLDVPGHDACRVRSTAEGTAIEGTAVFRAPGGAACLRYEVLCDGRWRSTGGRVEGWIGPAPVRRTISRTPDGWALDGAPVPGLEACLDLDLGFTPATNLFALRRLALPVGGAADAPAAWLDDDARGLHRLPQRYARVAETRYAYESETAGYAAELSVSPEGLVLSYPGVFQAEAIRPAAPAPETPAGAPRWSVRRAGPDDGATLASILNEVVAERRLSAADVPVTAASETAFLASLGPRGAAFVAEGEGGVAGYQTLESASRFGTSMDHVAIAGTQVRSAHRGRGVGRALWEATVGFARAQGYEKVVVRVRAGNARALRFYRGLGFQDVGVLRRQVRVDGAYDDEVVLERFLA